MRLSKAINLGRMLVKNPISVLFIHHINHLMEHVMAGHWTLDQLIDWVRSVEPFESESVAQETTECVEARP